MRQADINSVYTILFDFRSAILFFFNMVCEEGHILCALTQGQSGYFLGVCKNGTDGHSCSVFNCQDFNWPTSVGIPVCED